MFPRLLALEVLSGGSQGSSLLKAHELGTLPLKGRPFSQTSRLPEAGGCLPAAEGEVPRKDKTKNKELLSKPQVPSGHSPACRGILAMATVQWEHQPLRPGGSGCYEHQSPGGWVEYQLVQVPESETQCHSLTQRLSLPLSSWLRLQRWQPLQVVGVIRTGLS